jgi:hypothetical protein
LTYVNGRQAPIARRDRGHHVAKRTSSAAFWPPPFLARESHDCCGVAAGPLSRSVQVTRFPGRLNGR